MAIRFRPKPNVVRRVAQDAAEKARDVAQTTSGAVIGAAKGELRAQLESERDGSGFAIAGDAGSVTGEAGQRAAPMVGESPQPGGMNAGMLAMGSRAAQRSREADPSAASTELYGAMKGGVWGAGTDEARVFRALEGKSPAQIDDIRADYKAHYDRDLDSDLRSELGGAELTRAESLLQGDSLSADTDSAYHAMKGGLGAGTDTAQLFDTLEKNAGDPNFEARYNARHGGEKTNLRAHLVEDLSGPELDRANALLDGNRPLADAAKLREATAGVGTDESTLYSTLQGKSPAERKAIESAYDSKYGSEVSAADKEAHGGALRAHLAQDLSGAELDRANAALDGDTVGAKAAEIKSSMEGVGTKRQDLMNSLRTMPQEQKTEIEAAYAKKYGATIAEDLRGDLSSNDLKEANALHAKGELSDAEEVHYAMKGGISGIGTDTERLKDVFAGKTKEEVATVEQDYKTRYGQDLRSELFGKEGVPLDGELSGRDAFDIEMSMRGKVDTSTPEGAKENLSRAQERQEFERGGVRGLAGRALTGALGNDDGARLDENIGKATAAYDSAMADGVMTDAERLDVNKRADYAHADVGHYQEAKDSAGEAAGTIAATGAAAVVTAATMGAGAPLLATTLAAAGAGAVAKAGTEGLVKGRAYTNEEAATDAVSGAVEGATTAIGAHAGKALANKAAERTVAAARAEATTAVAQYATTEAAKVADDLAVQTAKLADNAGGLFGTFKPPTTPGAIGPMGPMGKLTPLTTPFPGLGAADDVGKGALGALKPPFGMGAADDVAKGFAGLKPLGGLGDDAGKGLLGGMKPFGGLGDDAGKGLLGGMKPFGGLGDDAGKGILGSTSPRSALANQSWRSRQLASLGATTADDGFKASDELISLATSDLLAKRQAGAGVRKVAWHAAEGAGDGALGGATGGASDAALNGDTWRNGVRDGLEQVGGSAVLGVAFGATTGAIVGAGTSALKKGGAPDDLIGDHVENSHLEMTRVNSVELARSNGVEPKLDANPRRLTLDVDGGQRQVRVHGIKTDADLEKARVGLQNLADAKGAAGLDELGDDLYAVHKIGTMDQQVNANRALEPAPPKVKVEVDGVEREFKVYGARGEGDLQVTREALEEWSARSGGPAKIHDAVDEIHLRDGLTTDGGIEGTAMSRVTDNKTLVIDRNLAETRGADRMKYVIWHEGGHKIDGGAGMQSEGGPLSPWGQGKKVTEYAGLNPQEDFAETHAHLIRDWDRITGDPKRYLNPRTDIGRKYRAILTNVYGQQLDDVQPAYPPPNAGENFSGWLSSLSQ